MNSARDDPNGPGFPIRISADQSLLATPHGFSQRATSFIASRCQGIHQVPLRRLIPLPVKAHRDKPRTPTPKQAVKLSSQGGHRRRPHPRRCPAPADPKPSPPIHNATTRRPSDGRPSYFRSTMSKTRTTPRKGRSTTRRQPPADGNLYLSRCPKTPEASARPLAAQPPAPVQGTAAGLVEATGFEPVTCCLQSSRSTQLSYAPS